MVQPLIKGDGATVAAGQTVVVNYVGIVWASGTVFDSSWTRGATFTVPIGAGQVIPGWDEGLVGQTVGSRVLLAIPPDKGYGSPGQLGRKDQPAPTHSSSSSTSSPPADAGDPPRVEGQGPAPRDRTSA